MISKTINQFYKHLKHTYFYFFIAWVVFLSITFIVTKLNLIEQTSSHVNFFQFFTPLFCLLVILIGYLFFYHKIKITRKEESLSSKLDEFGFAYTNKLAFLIGPGLFVSIVYLITKDSFHFITGSLIFILFLLERFSKKRMVATLKLDDSEKDLLKTKEFNIRSKDRGYFHRNPWAIAPLVLFLLYLLYDGIKGLL